VRTPQWKLVTPGPDKPWELYDMAADRTELDNLADKFPEKRNELAGQYEAWVRRCNLPV
jgi:arylsulfatase